MVLLLWTSFIRRYALYDILPRRACGRERVLDITQLWLLPVSAPYRITSARFVICLQQGCFMDIMTILHLALVLTQYLLAANRVYLPLLNKNSIANIPVVDIRTNPKPIHVLSVIPRIVGSIRLVTVPLWSRCSISPTNSMASHSSNVPV